MKILVLAVALASALVLGVGAAGAARECDGLMVCVPRVGPWVVVPSTGGVPRPGVRYQLSCPKGYVVGGLDAELSQRAIDVGFLGMLGSPVNPGVTTSRAAVFIGTYVGATARTPSFRPHIGCMPGAGGGSRVPTAATASILAGHPTIWRVTTARVHSGTATVSKVCAARERLVGASHAFGFYTRRPPSASLVEGVSGSLAIRGNRVSVRVTGDAEIDSVRAVVQVQAVCSIAS